MRIKLHVWKTWTIICEKIVKKTYEILRSEITLLMDLYNGHSPKYMLSKVLKNYVLNPSACVFAVPINWSCLQPGVNSKRR